MGHRVHTYRGICSWSGSTGEGYERYERSHRLAAPPARAVLDVSADPAFLGDPDLVNPEQLIVLAASSCQLLAFLALAARARIDVVAYEDDAEGVMPEDVRPMRITDVRLRPRITVRGPVSAERVASLADLAHRECYVANSLTTRVVVEPTVLVEAGAAGSEVAGAEPGTGDTPGPPRA